MSKFYNLFILLVLSAIITTAQTNIALTATVAQSGGGVTIYGPENYNDAVIPTYGSLPWGWVSSNGWIEYTWSSPQTMSGVKFFNDNRPFASLNIEYYNGAAYVPIQSVAGGSLQEVTVTFSSPVTGVRLRFNTIAPTSVNPNFREIEVYGLLGCTGAPDPGVASTASVLVPCNSAVSLTLSGADTGNTIDYQWQYNVGSGWTNFGTNDTFATFSALNVNTQFRCEVTCNTSQGGSAFSNTLNVSVIPSVPLNIVPANPEICQGESITISVTNGMNLSWEPPTGLDTLEGNSVIASPFLSHSYTVTGVDSNGCGTSASVYVQVNPLPTVIFNPATETLCQGDSIEMILQGGVAYSWLPSAGIVIENDSTFIVKPSTSTNYTVEVVNGYGCENQLFKSITVNPTPTPVITIEGTLLTAPLGYQAYMWYKDGIPVVPIAFQHQFNSKAPGAYHVVVTDSNDCDGASNIIDTRSTKIDDVFAGSVNIYPNPTSGALNIESKVSVNIDVKSIDGKILLTEKDAKTVDITHLSDGLYFLTIKEANGNGVYTQKVTKATK